MLVRSTAVRLRLDRKSIEETRDGAWIVEGVARIAGVLDYPEKGFREYVPPEALDPSSLINSPITIEHEVSIVTPDNFTDVNHGHVTEAWLDGDKLRFKALIRSQEAQDAINDGVKFLSTATIVDSLDKTPGVTPNGEEYDQVVRAAHINNLTLTRSPRAGEEAALRTDSKKTKAMKNLKIVRIDSKGNKTELSMPAASLPFFEMTKKLRTDAEGGEVKTGKLVVTKSDGQTVELVLAESMLDDLLASIGAGKPAAAEAKPEPAAAEGGEPRTDEGEEEDKDEEMRTDKKQLLAEVDRRLDGHRYTTDVARRAAHVMGDRSTHRMDAIEIMESAISLARPSSPDSALAASLAKEARSTRLDATSKGRAEGRLESLFDAVVEEAKARRLDSEGAESNALEFIRQTEGDGTRTDARPQSARDRRVARITGKRKAAAA